MGEGLRDFIENNEDVYGKDLKLAFNKSNLKDRLLDAIECDLDAKHNQTK